MTRFVNRLFDNPIVVQVAALLIACQIVAQIFSVILVTWRFNEWIVAGVTPPGLVAAVTLKGLFEEGNEAERARILSLAEGPASLVKIVPDTELVFTEGGIVNSRPFNAALSQIAPQAAGSFFSVQGRTENTINLIGDRKAAIRTSVGSSIVFDPSTAFERSNPPTLLLIILTLTLALPLAAISLWALRVLTAPLSRFSSAADRFALSLVPDPVAETGPREIRTLAHAFNTMCSRIRDLVEGRSRMLAAVSHDLRTPLTRIRLAADALPESDERERILRQTTIMASMITQALTYLRDESTAATREPVELVSLLQTICDDFADSGTEIDFDGRHPIVVVAEAEMLSRALTNLIENAVKFGSNVRVAVTRIPARLAEITIADDGPGIATNERETVFEPFGRGDKARSGEADGFGLGLTIARQVIESHHGSIQLDDTPGGGLTVRVTLPIAKAADHPGTVGEIRNEAQSTMKVKL